MMMGGMVCRAWEDGVRREFCVLKGRGWWRGSREFEEEEG